MSGLLHLSHDRTDRTIPYFDYESEVYNDILDFF